MTVTWACGVTARKSAVGAMARRLERGPCGLNWWAIEGVVTLTEELWIEAGRQSQFCTEGS